MASTKFFAAEMYSSCDLNKSLIDVLFNSKSSLLTLFDSFADDRLFFFYYSSFNGGILTQKYINEYGNIPTLRIARHKDNPKLN